MRIIEITEASTMLLYHLTPSRNIPQIMRTGLIPKIGVRSRLLKEPTPAIYVFNSVDDAEYALENWYGGQFSERTRIALLGIEIPNGATEITGSGYERILTEILG